MISSNGLIIIEMVSSETVDRGTVLFILKGETCLNGICHGAFGEVYGRSFVCFLGGVVRLSQNICQDRLHPVYETFHGDDHQNKPHQSHHHIISGFSKNFQKPR